MVEIRKASKKTYGLYLDDRYCGAACQGKEKGQLIVVLRGSPDDINRIIASEILHLVDKRLKGE